jgi:hypothetical protein
MAGSGKVASIGAVGAMIGAGIYAAAPWNPAVHEAHFAFRRDLDTVCGNSHAVVSAGQTEQATEFATVSLSTPVDHCPETAGIANVTSAVRIKYRQGDRTVRNGWTMAPGTTVARQDVPKGTGMAICGRVKYTTPAGPVQKDWYFTADGAFQPDATCNW